MYMGCVTYGGRIGPLEMVLEDWFWCMERNYSTVCSRQAEWMKTVPKMFFQPGFLMGSLPEEADCYGGVVAHWETRNWEQNRTRQTRNVNVPPVGWQRQGMFCREPSTSQVQYLQPHVEAVICSAITFPSHCSNEPE